LIGVQAHYGPHLRTKLITMREVSEDGSLAVLDREGPSSYLGKLKVGKT
jgi:hypothetical protein